jgi:hypothetical protein
MSRATAIKTKVDTVLRKYMPPDRTTYKRIVTRTGGNDLIGRPGSVTTSDTIFDPQPYYQQIGRRPVSGGRARVETMSTGSGQRTVDDYKFTFSASAISVADLQGANIQLVLKDSSGNSEVLNILDFDPIAMNNTVIAITVYARSTDRP